MGAVRPSTRSTTAWTSITPSQCPQSSATILAGTSGVGQTLLALHFLVEGARQNERCLHVSFDEPSASIVRRAKKIGLDLAPLCDRGTLTIRHLSPVAPIITAGGPTSLRHISCHFGIAMRGRKSSLTIALTPGDRTEIEHWQRATTCRYTQGRAA